MTLDPGWRGWSAALATLFLLLGAEAAVAAPSPGDTLSFEIPGPGHAPQGWRWAPEGTAFVDSTIVHEGRFAVRLERTASSESDFSVLNGHLPVTFSGDSLECRGWIRTDSVYGGAELWLRLDASPGNMLRIDNMDARPISGTTPWAQYRLVLPLDKRAKHVYFGAVLSGTGRAYFDDFELRVDGKPPEEAPQAPRPLSAMDTDHEFDSGSKITDRPLTSQDIDRLFLVGKVWGFLKYHHPRVQRGDLHWDYELFRTIPPIMRSANQAEAQSVLAQWVKRLGEVKEGSGAALPDSAAMLPRLDWIGDRDLLGAELSALLKRVYANRDTSGTQFYVSSVPAVGNPDFSSESGLPSGLPDAGYRLLALFRFWNIVEYWYPYRDLIAGNWDEVLKTFIPRVFAATTRHDYTLSMMELVARVGDTHANIWNALAERPPTGSCRVGAGFRFVEGQFVVGSVDSAARSTQGLQRGDVVTAIDGVPVDSLVAAWRVYYGASNDRTRMRDIARSLTQGPAGPCRLAVKRDGRPLEITAIRDSLPKDWGTHDLPGQAFQLLSKDVAYLKLSSVAVNDIPQYLSKAAGTRCFIIDIRNYPDEFVPFALGRHLIRTTTPFVRFTVADLSNPGAFLWTNPLSIEPSDEVYKGKIAILVDETSQSQAEYTAMALRAAPNAIVVGSQTAGADGNVSSVILPGGLRPLISGIGVFYPDKTPTQGIGIRPDLVVEPTIAGIRAGRDEILEAAIKKILGRSLAG